MVSCRPRPIVIPLTPLIPSIHAHHTHITANLVLQNTIERIYTEKMYCDIPRGVYIVRGENVLLLGEIVCDYDSSMVVVVVVVVVAYASKTAGFGSGRRCATPGGLGARCVCGTEP
jgi:hypothetical protein